MTKASIARKAVRLQRRDPGPKYMTPQLDKRNKPTPEKTQPFKVYFKVKQYKNSKFGNT